MTSRGGNRSVELLEMFGTWYPSPVTRIQSWEGRSVNCHLPQHRALCVRRAAFTAFARKITLEQHIFLHNEGWLEHHEV